MEAQLRLYLDLGDVLTKGIAVGPRHQRLRFPSATARQLVDDRAATGSLLLDEQQPLQRPADFDPSRFPRLRSYPGGVDFLTEIRGDRHPTSGARFAGWLAAAYGADRHLLGVHPTVENVTALVRKAFLLCAGDCETVEVVLVLDSGVKAAALSRYAEEAPREEVIDVWSGLRATSRRIQLRVERRIVDAASCAVAAIPAAVNPQQIGRLLWMDIGYFRTKLAIISTESCEHQEQLDSLGVADCVRRILRDGQDQGLVEDELAVMTALEQSQDTVAVAGRSFEIGEPLESAERSLEEELARAAERTVGAHFERHGEPCHGLAIMGGGAAFVGKRLASRLESSLGLRATWVAEDTRFLLVEGARRLSEEGAPS